MGRLSCRASVAVLAVAVIALDAETVGPARAQTAPGDQAAEVREFVRLVLGSRIHETTVAQFAPVFLRQMKATLETRLGRLLSKAEDDKILTAFKRSVASTVTEAMLEDVFIEITRRHYTPEEIRELLRFQRSPVGEKSRRLGPTLAEEGAAAGRKLFESRQVDFVRSFEEELRKEFSR